MMGCGFHPGLEEIALLETETGHRQHGKLSHAAGREEVRGFYASLPGPVRVGLEASGYSQWYEEMLEELGIELWVGIRRGFARPPRATRRPIAEMRGCCCN